MNGNSRLSVNGVGPHPELNHSMQIEGLREKNDTLTREVAFLHYILQEKRLELSRVIGYMNEFKRLFNKRQ